MMKFFHLWIAEKFIIDFIDVKKCEIYKMRADVVNVPMYFLLNILQII